MDGYAYAHNVNITIFCLDDEVKLLKNYYMHSNDFKSFVFSHSFMVNINLCEVILCLNFKEIKIFYFDLFIRQ